MTTTNASNKHTANAGISRIVRVMDRLSLSVLYAMVAVGLPMVGISVLTQTV